MSDVAAPLPVPVHLDAVLDGLAGNPALPAEGVRRLFARRRGFGAVARRPDLTPEMITEIIGTGDHWLVHSLALNQEVPSSTRMQLAGHRDPAVRAALALRAENAPREMFEILARDQDLHVREWLAQNEYMPADLRACLSADPDPKIRATLAQWWPQAPEPVRRILLTDQEDKVRAAACATYYHRLPHPIPPADLIPALLADPVTRAGVVPYIDLDPGTARSLAGDPDYKVRERLAQHPGLPAQLRDLLAEDPSFHVRLRVFARRDTPEAQRAAIHDRIMADARPLHQPSPDKDLDDETAILQLMNNLASRELRMLRLPWVTTDPLPHVDSPYLCFRASAAMSSSLPPQAIAQLLQDKESDVRVAMALHARDQVDAATAERIDRDYRPPKKTRWRPADTLPLPPETLRRLASDHDPRMRALSPRDPDLPADLAAILAADPDARVRREIASHPRLPAHNLLALLADPSESVARAAAANPILPPAYMHQVLSLANL